MARLRCARCFRHPPEGHSPREAFEHIYSLGYAKFSEDRPPKRQVIHLLCRRRFWTNHPDVQNLDLYSLKTWAVVPKGTRLAEL